MTTPPRRQLKDAVLERYLADALDGSAKASVEETLARSEADRLRVEELRADSAAFLVQHPPGRFAARVKPARRGRWWWVLGLVPAAVLAASLAVYVSGPTEPPWVVKGGVALAVHVRDGRGSVRLSPGEAVKPGAQLRFEVTAPAPGFVAVLSRDAQGKVTVYHPYGGSEAGPYEPAAPVLETAIELDATPGAEELYALYSERPFKTGWAVQALQAGEPLDRAAPKGVDVAHVTLEKR